MPERIATALAHPNIAFIKYWGNRDQTLRLPLNGSLSMNLDGLQTVTSIHFDPSLSADLLILDGEQVSGAGLLRVQSFLDVVRKLAGKQLYAHVTSSNNFPTGAGVASSASAFAALALAASAALGLTLDEKALSRLARLGSGSACRSIPAGFVEWQAGGSDQDSFAFSIAPQAHWSLLDMIVIFDAQHKPTGSSAGMALAHTSPLQAHRLADAPRRLDLCRKAVLARDFSALAEVAEADSDLMHAVMQSSIPPLKYTLPQTDLLLQAVRQWRKEGHAVFGTVDAGPNVHLVCLPGEEAFLSQALAGMPGIINVLTARPGGPARLLPETF